MKTFVNKGKRFLPTTCRSQLFRFGYVKPEVKSQQAGIRAILRTTDAQAKFTIGQPNDKYEQEADRVADQVMAMPDPKLQRQPKTEEEEEPVQTKGLSDQITPLVQRAEEPPEEDEEMSVQSKYKGGNILQRICPECEEEMAKRQTGENKEEELQAKPKTGETPAVTPSIESHINSMRGSAQPLNTEMRSFFESRFGHDFSLVRVHTGASAEKSASEVNAKAFTLGRDVVFGRGQFDFSGNQGKRLLAHELTHVIQQKDSRSTILVKSPEQRSLIQRRVSIAGINWNQGRGRLFLNRRLGRSSSLRRIMWNILRPMIRTTNTFVYANCNLLYRYLLRRRWLIRQMGRINSIGCCGYDSAKYRPQVNSSVQRFWTHLGGYIFELNAKGRRRADIAVAGLFRPQSAKSNKTLIDCTHMIVALQYYSIMQSLGLSSRNTSEFHALKPGYDSNYKAALKDLKKPNPVLPGVINAKNIVLKN